MPARMMKATFLVLLSLSCLVVFVQCYGGRNFDPLKKLIRADRLKERLIDTTLENSESEFSPVYVAPQDGLKAADKIESLPGQPNGALFDQYSGYVTVDPNAGRALFYYFTESPQNSSTKPLVLWLNGGPGCSSFGNGAMMELGPYRVHSDGETLQQNEYAWNNAANILFLESPAGVGFSYSNTTSDYNLSGDKRTAEDSYTFLVNWLERFPEYKTRDFFLTGESYAGHYVPQLAQLILQNNKNTNQTVINLKGIAFGHATIYSALGEYGCFVDRYAHAYIGNAWIDFETGLKGMYDFFWTHALVSDEINEGINLNCNFSTPFLTGVCNNYLDEADNLLSDIFIYDIYAPLCGSSNSPSISAFDPCSSDYIYSYLNIPQVQKALHANVTALPYPWESCRQFEYPSESFLLYIVGGYAVGYQNLTFVTIRGAGHFVPSYQPARGLAFFSSFLEGKLPPSS
ncbi:hypothetical protein HHK36_030898 [Tetracentron sinense]|uniref:Carboxypeptidase n=1 Tax=Tetracentron sinense TaxID=13715 RepID=A0A835D151_TETSI|nr:hypothetical protein HHK36_030898 [Tetracentron sinense]